MVTVDLSKKEPMLRKADGCLLVTQTTGVVQDYWLWQNVLRKIQVQKRDRLAMAMVRTKMACS